MIEKARDVTLTQPDASTDTVAPSCISIVPVH